MQNLIIATMTIGCVAASNTVATASDFLCSNYVQSTSAVFTSGGELTSKTDHGLNAITMLTIGAYLADKNVVFSEASTDVQTEAFKNFYLYCQKNPDELAVDAAINAVIRVNMKPTYKPTTQVKLVDASPLKITADEIAKGISGKKTELEQEAWWAETMSGKTYQLTGKVSEVEKGTFSGYWVNLDIGRNIMVRCGMSSAGEATVKSLKKGQQFTCKGVVSSTWTSIFGTTFQVDAG